MYAQEFPALCLKFASKSSDPKDEVHWVLDPKNFVMLKPFEGYKPLGVENLNKERAAKGKSTGQWFISIFRSLNHSGHLANDEGKLPTSLPSKVMNSLLLPLCLLLHHQKKTRTRRTPKKNFLLETRMRVMMLMKKLN